MIIFAILITVLTIPYISVVGALALLRIITKKPFPPNLSWRLLISYTTYLSIASFACGSLSFNPNPLNKSGFVSDILQDYLHTIGFFSGFIALSLLLIKSSVVITRKITQTSLTRKNTFGHRSTHKTSKKIS